MPHGQGDAHVFGAGPILGRATSERQTDMAFRSGQAGDRVDRGAPDRAITLSACGIACICAAW
jgi:hypothetical protein